MMQLDADPERNRAIWDAMPRMPWLLAGRAKPGATVLAVAAGRDDQAAVIAAQPYGLGKVLWIGTDGTWRFRFRAGDRYHHRFWGQVVRWAAHGSLAAGNSQVRFGPVKPRSEEGEGVSLQARISEGIAGVGPELLIAARIFKTTCRELRHWDGRARCDRADASRAGSAAHVRRPEYRRFSRARMSCGSMYRSSRRRSNSIKHRTRKLPEASIEIVSRESSERVELAAARDQVEQLASATGGRVLADYEANELAGLLHAAHQADDADGRDAAVGSAGLSGALLWNSHGRVGGAEEGGAAVNLRL